MVVGEEVDFADNARVLDPSVQQPTRVYEAMVGIWRREETVVEDDSVEDDIGWVDTLLLVVVDIDDVAVDVGGAELDGELGVATPDVLDIESMLLEMTCVVLCVDKPVESMLEASELGELELAVDSMVEEVEDGRTALKE